MLSGSRRVGGVVGSVVPQTVTVGASIPTIGLSRVASGTTIGNGLSHHHSQRFGSGLPVSRPTSSYVPTGLSTGFSSGGGYVSSGSFGMNAGTSYGISPQTVMHETTTYTSPTSGRYLSPNGGTYVTTTNSPSITEIKSSEPRIISR